MRLFVAIDIAEEIRTRLERFLEGVRPLAPDANWVRPGSFHLTLKFLGETPPEKAEALRQSLVTVEGEAAEVRFCGLGFFPNPNRARVFWVGVEADARLTQLAQAVDEATARLGFERDRQPYHPHLTLARAGERTSSNPHARGSGLGGRFGRLQERLAAQGYGSASAGEAGAKPDFGTMTAREFHLYESRLAAGGARYSKVASFPLK